MAANKFHSQHSISSFTNSKMIEKAMLMSGVVSLPIRKIIDSCIININYSTEGLSLGYSMQDKQNNEQHILYNVIVTVVSKTIS